MKHSTWEDSDPTLKTEQIDYLNKIVADREQEIQFLKSALLNAKANNNQAYWEERCLAAEAIILNAIQGNDKIDFNYTYSVWTKIKNNI